MAFLADDRWGGGEANSEERKMFGLPDILSLITWLSMYLTFS